MKDQIDHDSLADSEFQSLLVQCLEKLERGESLDREALVGKHPRYAQPLGEFIDNQGLLKKIASGIRDEMGKPSESATAQTMDSGSSPRDFSAGDQVRYIGEYEILSEIARGGMGIVFKARQQSLHRVVALKMILAGRHAEGSDIERFQREARAAGRLKHPHIVPVHEIGEHEGRHYFTMDFVEGRSLSESIREETLAPRDAAELVRTTAEAVQYAHEQGTVHRDLKPANVMIGDNGQPYITDFGLAKMFESVDDPSRAELTASGQILGTPSYMSPEQASGKQELVGPASDIYSLGAILYACLTGRAPFVADSPVDTLLQVLRNEPVSPKTLNPSVPRNLETICLKCLHKEPHRRYGTAQELADDLGRFIEGRPVVARPVGLVSRYFRWCRRNPVIAALSVLLFASMASGTTIASTFAVDAMQHARREELQRRQAEVAQLTAEEQRTLAEQARHEAERQQKVAMVAKAQAEWSYAQEMDARLQTERARRDVVRSLYVARTYLTRLLWERGDKWGASLPQVEQFFSSGLTITNPDPEIELETLSHMIAANLSDDFLHFQRGIYYAKRRQWEESLADLELSSHLTSQQYWYHCETASVALMVEDYETYDRHMQSLLKHLTEFEEASDVLSGANVALIASLRPQPPEVLSRMLPFTERWASARSSQFFRMKSLILVRLRLGEYETVLKLLEPFTENASFKRTEHEVLAGSIQALALHHLGRTKEAKRVLDKAQIAYTDHLMNDFVAADGSLQETHHPFIQAHVLLREARNEIENVEANVNRDREPLSLGASEIAPTLVHDLDSSDSMKRDADHPRLEKADGALTVRPYSY